MENPLSPLLPVTPNLSAVMVMIGLGGFFALLALIGHKMSTSSSSVWRFLIIKKYFAVRVKEMLRSGNYSVAGDQWPILMYKDEIYDPEDPWRGLFKNRILVLV